MYTSRPKSRITRAALSIAALALVASACGGSASAADESATTSAATATTEASLGDSGVASIAPTTTVAPEVVEEPVTEANAEVAIEEYKTCMTGEGIDVSFMDNAGGGAEVEAIVSSDEFVAAEAICQPILDEAFGSFELDSAFEAQLAERSAELAACGREVLGIDIPDDILMLDEDDPRMLELENMETTPEEDAAIEKCFEDILGDLFDEDGVPVTEEAGDNS